MIPRSPTMQPIQGTLKLLAEQQVVQCGQYHLGYHWSYLSPQQVPGAPSPADAETVTLAVSGGSLTLLVSCRRAPETSLANVRVGVRLATWLTWPGPFGGQGQGGPSTKLRHWGPEITQRLETMGSCRVDLAEWADGARFIAVELVTWSLDGGPVDAELDWQIIEDGPTKRPVRPPWPVSIPSEKVSSEPLPPSPQVPSASQRVGSVGAIRGNRPRFASVTNTGDAAATVAVVTRHGAARTRLADVVVLPGTSQVVTLLGVDDPATGLDIYASSPTDSQTPLTLDFG